MYRHELSHMCMKKNDGCEVHSCISVHIDDFIIAGNNQELMMRKFEEKFLIRTQKTDLEACLVVQWEVSEKDKRKVHNKNCIKEVIMQLEKKLRQ